MSTSKNNDDASTRTVVKEALAALGNSKKDYYPTKAIGSCGRNIEDCHYDKDKEQWWNSQMLKTAGVVVAVLSPLFVWIIVSIFELKADNAVKAEKLVTIEKKIDEVVGNTKETKEALESLRLEIAKSGRISWVGPAQGTNP